MQRRCDDPWVRDSANFNGIPLSKNEHNGGESHDNDISGCPVKQGLETVHVSMHFL